MADTAAQQLSQKQGVRVEYFFDKDSARKLQNSYPWLNFRIVKDFTKETSLLYDEGLEEFLISLGEAINNFQKTDQKSVKLDLSLFGIGLVNLPTNEFRKFSNTFLQLLLYSGLSIPWSFLRDADKADKIFSYNTLFGQPYNEETDGEALELLERAHEALTKFVEDPNNFPAETDEEKKEEKPTETATGASEAATSDDDGFDLSGGKSDASDQGQQEGAESETPADQQNRQPLPQEQVKTTQPQTEPGKPLTAAALRELRKETIRESNMVKDKIKEMCAEMGIPEFEITPELYSTIQAEVRSILNDPEKKYFAKGKLDTIQKQEVVKAAFIRLAPQVHAAAEVLKSIQKAPNVTAEQLEKVAVGPQNFVDLANKAEADVKTNPQEVENQYSEQAKKYFEEERKRILAGVSITDASDEKVRELAGIMSDYRPGVSVSKLEPFELQELLGISINDLSVGKDKYTKFFERIDKEAQKQTYTPDEILGQEIERVSNQFRNRPEEGFAEILKTYDIDPTAVGSREFQKTFEAYVLAQGDPNLFFKRFNPVLLSKLQLPDNPELRRQIEIFGALRMAQNAEMSGNDLAKAPRADFDPELASDYKNNLQLYSQPVMLGATYVPDAVLNQGTSQVAVQARELRSRWRITMETEIFSMDPADQDLMGAEYGLFRADFRNDLEFANNLVLQNYNDQLFNAAGMQADGPIGFGPGGVINHPMMRYLNPLRGGVSLKKKAAKETAKQAIGMAKKGIIRTVAPAIGAGAAGLGIGAIASQVLGFLGTAGGTLASAGLGALAGFAIGGPIGAIVGGIGGALGFTLFKGTGGASGAKVLSGTVTPQLKAMAAGGKEFIGSAAAGGGGAATPLWPTAAAVFFPIGSIAILTTITMTTILTAFLPDASTVQVAPYYITDIVQSKYIDVVKKPSIANANEPTQISYEIIISRKTDDPETAAAAITIDEITDQPGVQAKDNRAVTAPALPPEFVTQLEALKGQPLEAGQPITLTVTLDFSATDFQDTLAINNLKVEYLIDGGDQEEANVRAQTCFGDCPKGMVAPCWPITGPITQGPYGRGPYSNPIINADTRAMGITHYNYTSDAYDIGTNLKIGDPIFASTPGIVTYAQEGTGGLSGYGNLVQVDHGGFQTFYAHMHEIEAVVGQDIKGGEVLGYVGSTGNSSGPHLHYEVVGLNEYILETILDPDKRGSNTIGPRCDEYYGVSTSN